MKDLMAAGYWALVGALAASVSSLIVPVLPAFYSTVYLAGSPGLPAFVLVIPFVIGLAGALVMGLIGLSFTRRGNAWAALLGFGGLPAAWLCCERYPGYPGLAPTSLSSPPEGLTGTEAPTLKT